jgi:type II secretory ATPase GspE/PulE/Tfp pilus assembly ATPase PilB-like protein
MLKAFAGQYLKKDERAVLITDLPVNDWLGGDILAVKPEIGFSRAVALRAAKSADYKFVLVDFIASVDEVEILIDLAENGKFVLLALPWFSPSKCFHYLWQILPEKSVVRKIIKGIVVEKDLPKLCTRCRTQEKLSLQGSKAIENIFAGMSETSARRLKAKDLYNGPYYRAKGCHLCHNSGFAGGEYCYSVVKLKKPDYAALSNFHFNDLISKNNFISLRQAAIIKASEGHFDLMDALSFTY